MIWLFALFPLIGAWLAHKFSKSSFDLSVLMLFSGAYLLTVTLAGILPEALSHGHSIWLWVGIGYVLQLLFDVFSKGVEHGHIHDTKTLKITPLFIALFLHALLEGMPLALLGKSSSTLINYFIGLALHEIPAAFVLGYILINQNLKKLHIYILVVLYAFAIPFGFSIASTMKTASWYTNQIEHVILALCSGILLHIATTVITENFKHHSFNKKKWLAFSLGLTVAVISLFSHKLFH